VYVQPHELELMMDWRLLLLSQINEAGDPSEVPAASGGRARREEACLHQMITLSSPQAQSVVVAVTVVPHSLLFASFLDGQDSLSCRRCPGYYDSFSAKSCNNCNLVSRDS
jgi:hypothetical protein